MMNWYKYSVALLFLASAMPSVAQQILQKNEAVRLALENNYGIRIAQNKIRIAENNTSIYNTGYLPTVTASAGSNINVGGSSQTFSSGQEIDVNAAASWGANASVAANYSLYNKARTYNVESLKESRNLADLEARQTMELSAIQLLASYYEVARLSNSLALLEQTLHVSRRRIQRAQFRVEYGQGTRLEILNAEVDIKRDSINLLNTRQQVSNARRNLNFVMGRDVNEVFEIDTTVVFTAAISRNALVQQAKNNNVEVLILDKNTALSRINLQIIDAGKKPTIGANANYAFSFQDNPSNSFIAKSNSRGLSLGLNLSWNIFDGGGIRTRTGNTRIALENFQVFKQQLEQELERSVANTWESYQNALFVLEAEKKNLATNELNFQRTEEQFNIGQVTSVEFRQAQLNLLNAATNLSNAKYNAKVLELQLLQLSGSLLGAEY